jgi:serine/threonine protein kinase
MAGSTITVSVGQFAQQLRQKYPQYGSVPDDKLIAAFLSKNPKYTGNYEGVTLVSVSFEPAAADAAAEKPDVTSSIQSQPVTSPEMPYLGSTVIVNVPAVPAPPMIGKYEIIEELGRGAMGLVYKAFDTGIGRTVALKVMSEQLACDTEFRSRFLREARGAGILQHPNIVTVYELGEWQGAPFIAMEFLEGRSLEDILKNAKTTPLEKRLDIMVQVCRGLDYAHARGVVHRDIKPANVMVTTDGVAKVVDFGIARLADQKLTQVGQVLGTVSYMSPEQLQGKALDGRSDIFAVGVMLFEALTSVLPFAAENTGSAVTNILYRQPPSLSKFLTNYPGELDDVLKKCLAKDPTERLQTAGELADKLSRVQQELQRAQTAPTVIRSTSGAANPSNLQTPSLSDATRQLSQAALQSVDSAKEWWKVASPESRAKAITIAIPILLYLQALIAPSGGFSDTRLGGGFVTSSTIVLPVAILSAVVISIGVWGQRWKDSPSNVKVFVGAVGFIVVAFCADKIALGLMWYLIVSKTFLVLVLALLGIYAWTNISFALDLWRRGSGKERAISALGVVLVAGLFSVTFSLNLVDYAKNWRMSGGDRPERATNQQPSPMPQAVEAIPTSQSQSQSVPPPTTPTPAYSAWRESTGDYVATSSASIPAFSHQFERLSIRTRKRLLGKRFSLERDNSCFRWQRLGLGCTLSAFPGHNEWLQQWCVHDSMAVSQSECTDTIRPWTLRSEFDSFQSQLD